MLITRNFIIDYRDEWDMARHIPFQYIDLENGCNDFSLTKLIQDSVKNQFGGTVSLIIEIIGTYTMQDLENIIDSKEKSANAEKKILYLDAVLAMR